MLPAITPARDPEDITELPRRCELSATALSFLTETFHLFSADGRCLSRHRKVERDPADLGSTHPGYDNGDFDYNFGTAATANNTSSVSVDEVARVFRVCPDGQPPWSDEDVEVHM